MRQCVLCGGRFDRLDIKPRKLKDGNFLDLSQVCLGCESDIAKAAAIKAVQKTYTPPDVRELERMDRECLRKEAFTDPGRARKVAKRMRNRHDGHSLQVYRCRASIDVIAFPDRGVSHFHIGGSSDRKI